MGFLAYGFGVCEKPTPWKKLAAGTCDFHEFEKGKSSCKTACLGFHVNFQGCTFLVANGWRSPTSCNRRCVLFMRWDRFPFCSVINILKGNTFWKRCFIQGGGSWVYSWDEWWFTGDDWWMMNEWMNDWNFGRATGQFLHLIGMSHGSLTIPGFICLRSVSTPGGFGRQHPIKPTLLSWTLCLKSWCSLRFPITRPVPTPAPIQKTCLRIYDFSINLFMYSFIYMSQYLPFLQ